VSYLRDTERILERRDVRCNAAWTSAEQVGKLPPAGLDSDGTFLYSLKYGTDRCPGGVGRPCSGEPA
jgi:hypothetical protein